MTLQKIITSKLSCANLSDIVQFLGYGKKQTPKAVKRIENLLKDEYLGLYSNIYDFKYSNFEFLAKLTSVIGIDINAYKKDIQAINTAHCEWVNRFKLYIFVDTEFVKGNQPVFALAACDHQRYMRLDDALHTKPLHEQIIQVQALIGQHYTDTNGVIGIWGSIKRYIFFYARVEKVAFTTDGAVLNVPSHINVGKAHFKINNNNERPHSAIVGVPPSQLL